MARPTRTWQSSSINSRPFLLPANAFQMLDSSALIMCSLEVSPADVNNDPSRLKSLRVHHERVLAEM